MTLNYSLPSVLRLLAGAVFLTLTTVISTLAESTKTENCVVCHAGESGGFLPAHRFGSTRCSLCHQGNPAATDKTEAHRGLIHFPGNLENAAQTCGACHAKQVQSVSRGFMHSGKGMVAVTRNVFGETPLPDGHDDLSALGQTPADSLLRKQCASCHLGQEKSRHAHDVVRDRGGGCLACHINAYPEDTHPALTARVEDGRCFGCHSRSGRISLSYAGLAEMDIPEPAGTAVQSVVRLDDGRTLEARPRDVHHKAGMSCIDCHTGKGLMGAADHFRYQEDAVDIACTDCHRNENPRTSLSSWPEEYRSLLRLIPATRNSQQSFLTTQRFGSPLWHIEVRKGANYLFPKLGGTPLRIPEYSAGSHRHADAHRRLSCNACHSQWAPQCYGCHLEYDPKSSQWDHTLHRATPGRWYQNRWNVRNTLPALGVTANDRIAPFVPGMILTIAHPAWETPRFARRFARAAPHTTGKARSCETCHRSSVALGLGGGTLEKSPDGWQFSSRLEPLTDGLPADAWTTIDGAPAGEATRSGDRSFTREEILRILNADPQPVPETE